MRHLLAGACSLLLLAGCGSTVHENAIAPPADRAPAVSAGGTTSCTSPAGYTVDHPDDWSVNTGDVLPACSWFDPEPVAVPEATDARAAITFRVEDGIDPHQPWPDEQAREHVRVDGRDAVRIEQLTAEGFYPAGTPITTYLVPLDDGRTLVADTAGVPGADYDVNVATLDAMMSTLEVDGAGRV